MRELIALAIQKPLNAIIVVLCTVVFAVHTDMIEVSEAMAIMRSEQAQTKLSHQDVLAMKESIIKIETNVSSIRKHQEEVSAYVQKEVEYQILKAQKSGEF